MPGRIPTQLSKLSPRTSFLKRVSEGRYNSEQPHPPRQNSKSEARNPKQCQMSQIKISKRARLQAAHFRDLEIRILNLFRISKFELRISQGKLDHFVNFVVTKKTLVSSCLGGTPHSPPRHKDTKN